MENKPITKFLRNMSKIYIFVAAWTAFIGAIALISVVAPIVFPELAAEFDSSDLSTSTYINIVVSLVCGTIDVYIGYKALMHKNLGNVCKIGILTMIVSEIFTAADIGAPADWVSLAVGFIVPVLFLIAVFGQIKLDGKEK